MKNLRKTLIACSFFASMFADKEVAVYNATPYTITLRVVTYPGCSSESEETIPAGQIKTAWHFNCRDHWHFDISDEWSGNKSWMSFAGNKNRSWGYSYENTPLEWADNKMTVKIEWDTRTQSPKLYMNSGPTYGYEIKLR